MAKHLAIFQDWAILDILSGKKQIEGRFSKSRIAPFGKVSPGDRVFMKPPGKPILGEFVVDRVFHFDHPKVEELAELKEKYKEELGLPSHFWSKKDEVNYATLIFIGRRQKFLTPPRQVTKKDLRGWVVLT